MDEYVGNSRDPFRSRRNTSSLQRRFMLTRFIALLLIPVIGIIISLLSPHNTSVASLAHHVLRATKLTNVHSHPLHLPKPPFALFSTRVVLPNQKIQPAYILVGENGKIYDVRGSVASLPSKWRRVIVDVKPLVIMPGLIDPHVHINEPGREHWEGIESATRAAAAGGTTTLLDMPLYNLPATKSGTALEEKLAALEAAPALVDIGLIGGVIHGNVDNIESLFDGGVVALASSRIDSQSADFPRLNKQDLQDTIEELERLAAKTSEKIRPIPYILQAELDDNDPSTGSRAASQEKYDHGSYDSFERSHPGSWETEAIRMASEIANSSGVHIHIAHVSSHEAVKRIAELKRTSTFHGRISAGTCPHYLLWEKEDIPNGAAEYKCRPPIRSRSNRHDLLSSVFQAGDFSDAIDLIASDHSPCPDELKRTNGNLTKAWEGISGLQYRLQGTWTAATEAQSDILFITKLLAEGPAKVFGLDHMKGFLKAGLDADMVIWNPESETHPSQESCHHKHKISAFHNAKVRGTVAYTILRGELVYSNPRYDKENWQFGKVNGRILYRSKQDGIVRSEPRKNWRKIDDKPDEK